MKTYFIKTFGCQQNSSDSERIEGDYQARGYKPAKSWKTADEIVINTCAVRQRAEDRARGLLHNVDTYFKEKALQSRHSGAKQSEAIESNAKKILSSRKARLQDDKHYRPKIILTGCMVHHGKNKILDMMPSVDEILPVGEVGFNQSAVRRDKTHAWVPISTGCNSFCTFCIVPYSRGREKSRPLKDIITEIKHLAKNGYTEVTLLGMNVNSWGLEKVGIGFRKLLMNSNPLLTKTPKRLSLKDLPSNMSQYKKFKGTPPFVKLLREISKIKGIEKIRFITSNPWDFHDELISEIADNKKIDRYIHLPIQSGSNKVLKLMNRGYTREDYLNLVQKLRDHIKDVVVGTDIIVGFPGETKKDFQDTVKLAKQIDWKVGFVAQYSPRPGTAAWRIYKDTISPQEKKRRWEILDKIINKDNLKVRPKIVS